MVQPGYVATELIKQLLEKGYNVVGTVRSSGQNARTDTLTKLGEALTWHSGVGPG